MGPVKQIQVPDDLFEELERFRRSLRTSRVEALRILLAKERAKRRFLTLSQRQAQMAKGISDEEAMRIAVEEVRRVRSLHRARKRQRSCGLS